MPKCGKCGKCGAAIEFYPTVKTGKPMPVDAEPNPNGNLVLIEVNGFTKIGQAPPPDPEDDGVANGDEDNPYRAKRYTSHFATCSAADFYRKKGLT